MSVAHVPTSIADKNTESAAREQAIRLLEAQLQAQTNRTDFLEDCIAEMAGQLYSV